MNNCIFCKIVAGEIPSYTVYEDDKTKAFLDIKPVAKGHLLLITKKHYAQFENLPSADLAYVFKIAQKIRPVLKESLGAKYVVMTVAGDEIDHFHIQFVPRRADDGLTNWPPSKLTEDTAEELVKVLKPKFTI